MTKDTAQNSGLPHERSEKEIDQILKQHLPWIQKYVHRKLGDFPRSKMDTGDIVQEATVNFLKYGPRFNVMNEKECRLLLCKIVENALRNKYEWFTACRRNMALERPLPPDSMLNLDPTHSTQETPSQIAAQHEEEAWLRLGLELLDPEEREVIVMHHWELLSFDRIGKIFGMSSEGARKKFVRALNILIRTVQSLKNGRLADIIGEDLSLEMDR